MRAEDAAAFTETAAAVAGDHPAGGMDTGVRAGDAARSAAEAADAGPVGTGEPIHYI